MDAIDRATNFAKSVVYGIQHFADKKSRERLIRRFDQRTLFRPVEAFSNLATNGWIKTDSISLFGVPLADILETKVVGLAKTDKFGNAISRDIPKDAMATILGAPMLVRVVQSYLGAGARLDDIYLWSKDFEQQQTFDLSEGWHSDNVGNRIKVFICIEASPDAPSTLVVDRTHNRQYRIGLEEFGRFFGRIGAPTNPDGVVEIKYGRDTVSIFDTNALHRGSYAAKRARRICLILEFVDREKSDLLSGACPCGPGQSPDGRVIFAKSLRDQLWSHKLIDRSLLREEAECISYSISNKRSM